MLEEAAGDAVEVVEIELMSVTEVPIMAIRGVSAPSRVEDPRAEQRLAAPYSSGASLKRGEDSATMMSVPSANKAVSRGCDASHDADSWLAF